MIERVARIEWLSAEQGGRKSPPSGPRYVAPARVEGGSEKAGADGANWSLVVEMLDRSGDAMTWTANVRFLVDEAPNELLTDGASFELYEGKNCVARGSVMPSTVAANAATQPVAAPHQVG